MHSVSKIPIKAVTFTSFDGGTSANGFLQCPDRYRHWSSRLSDNIRISRGAGLSYAAASFANGVVSVDHRSFNRVLDFDSQSGVVEVEAGIELATLHAFLSARGVFLPVQPGHGRITVGGCIAADVHGKNQARDGTFINQILGLILFHPSYGSIEVSRSLQPDLFRLTCGGYGLTGHILRAKLQANPLPSHTVKIRTLPVPHLLAGMNLLMEKALESDFSYSWHDFMSKGGQFGQGFVYVGQFISDGDAARASKQGKTPSTPTLSSAARSAWRVPFYNVATTRMLNLAFRGQQKVRGLTKCIELEDALFPIHAVQYYFKLFGSPGFHEYQMIIPVARISDYIEAVQAYLSRHPTAVTLASAKLFRGRQELLRFTGDGICFAVNVPRTSAAISFLAFLDELVISIGGMPNIIKDSRLPRSVVWKCYPEAQRFCDLLRKFDPDRLFKSELSERLGL